MAYLRSIARKTKWDSIPNERIGTTRVHNEENRYIIRKYTEGVIKRKARLIQRGKKREIQIWLQQIGKLGRPKEKAVEEMKRFARERSG